MAVNCKRFNSMGLLIALVTMFLCVIGCQPASEKSPPRVGVVLGLEFFGEVVDAFVEEMESYGYINGETVVYDIQRMTLDPERETQVLEKFVADKVDLIVTIPTEATIQAKQITADSDIPVLFGYASLEGTDLVENITEPGGNLTGVRFPGPDLAVKRIESVLTLKPDAKNILIPYLQGYPNVPHQLKAIRETPFPSDVVIIEAPAQSPPQLQEFITEYSQSDKPPIDAIVLIAEPLAVSKDFFDVYGPFAKAHNLPVVGVGTNAAGVETLMGLYPSDKLTGSQLAFLANKILKGEAPATIPVLSPDYEMYVDLTKAQRLQITVAEDLLNKADHIIH